MLGGSTNLAHHQRLWRNVAYRGRKSIAPRQITSDRVSFVDSPIPRAKTRSPHINLQVPPTFRCCLIRMKSVHDLDRAVRRRSGLSLSSAGRSHLR
jgi:hypothetical protein